MYSGATMIKASARITLSEKRESLIASPASDAGKLDFSNVNQFGLDSFALGDFAEHEPGDVLTKAPLPRRAEYHWNKEPR